MKKKTILIFAILTIFIIPVTVFATNNIISSIIATSENEISIDYSKIDYSEEEYLQNRKQKENMLKKYMEDNHEKAETNIQTIESQNNALELENKLNESDEEISNNIKYIISIVRRYYPNEVDTILQEAETEENKMNSTGTYIAISQAECKLINLIINIIEQENITEDECNVLKDYISNQDFKLKEIGELELIKKIENTLNK